MATYQEASLPLEKKNPLYSNTDEQTNEQHT